MLRKFSTNRYLRRTGIFLAVVFSLTLGSALRAQETQATDSQPAEARVPEFNEAMKQMADEVSKFLVAENQTSLVVGPFNGPPATSGGPGIVQGIKDNLPKEINTAPAAGALGLSGKFRLTKDKSSGKHCIVVEAAVTDSLGESQLDMTKYILTDEQSVQTLMGGNGTLPTTAPPGQTLAEARDEAIVENIKNPTVALQPSGPAGGPNTVLRPAGDSPYGIEILILGPQGYQPVPIVNQNGLPFVEIPKDQIYAVRLINDSPEPAGAAVVIDGINSLAFSQQPGFKQAGKWVVNPKNPKSMVKGWHKIGNQASSFKVTEYGASVAGRAGIVGPEIGTITVAFCAAFSKAPPSDEPKPDLVQRGDLATGEGPPVEQASKPVFMNFGVSRGTVSVRYNRGPDDLPPPQ